MIDLHLSAFAPRWRFLYAVRIDAYIEKALLLQGFQKMRGPFFDKNVRKTDLVQYGPRWETRTPDILLPKQARYQLR